MNTCEGIIEASVKFTPSEDENGNPSVTNIPERPCDQPGILLSRSMREIVTSEIEREDGTTVQLRAWEKEEDHRYCPQHFVYGTMRHLDGTTSQHPVMMAD